MATTLKNKMDRLGAQRRKRVEARAQVLIAEEMSLRDLRQAHELPQARMSEVLGIGQDGISRLEKRSDLLISTLRGFVEAMGGELRLVAEFPDRPPVILSGLAGMERLKAARVRNRVAGEETIITRRGRPVAKLVPSAAPKKALRSLSEFRATLPKARKSSAELIRVLRDDGY